MEDIKMRVAFSGTLHETEDCKGLRINLLSVRKTNGDMVLLDRDSTFYSIYPDGHFDAEFRNVYTWDPDQSLANYNLDLKDFVGAKLINYEIEDDADDDYNLIINEDSFVCS